MTKELYLDCFVLFYSLANAMIASWFNDILTCSECPSWKDFDHEENAMEDSHITHEDEETTPPFSQSAE